MAAGPGFGAVVVHITGSVRWLPDGIRHQLRALFSELVSGSICWRRTPIAGDGQTPKDASRTTLRPLGGAADSIGWQHVHASIFLQAESPDNFFSD